MDPNKIDKYLYIDRTPTWLIRVIYSIGLLTWGGVIYGYSKFYISDPIFFWTVGPLITFLIVYHILSYGITLFYKQFDLSKHRHFIRTYNLRQLSKTKKDYPAVDIFLPICGEETDVIQNTFDAVSKLDYPNYKVYVLDDRGDSDHRSLAHHYHFIYMSRDNKGEMKKAGNLKHGFERSDGDFIVVYDADFAPHPDFIRELMPYMQDPKVAIIQSPQYFQTDREVHKTSALQYGASHVQEDFYRFIQVARSRLGAPICCGSNAIYRRSALNEIGGTVQIEHSEDAYTGFELTNKGYRVLFIPIILAIGLCPDNLHSYFHQQHRWCSGSLSLMLSKKFWNSKLSFSQKLCFISGFMYYLSHPITILLSLQIFFLLYFYHDVSTFKNALPFLPCILFSFFVIPMFRITRQRFGGFLARNSYMYSYSHATIVALLKQSVGWQPTNTKRVDVSKEYKEQLYFIALYFLLYITLVAFSVGNGSINLFNFNTYTLLFWVFYNVISTSIILIYLYLLMDSIKSEKAITKSEKRNFSGWRFKTAGVYLITLFTFSVAASAIGINVEKVFGNKNENIINSQEIAIHNSEIVETVSDQNDQDKTVVLEIIPNTTNSTSTINFKNDLTFGDQALDVKRLQVFLNNNGYLLAETGPGSLDFESEYFGERTKRALINFQIKNDLPVTGFFGPKTRDLINSSEYVF